MQRLLILGAGEIQVPVIQKSKELGFYTIVADFDKNAPGFVFADDKAIISTLDLEGVLNLAKDKKIDGILTTSDYPVNIVAKVAEILQLNAMTPLVAQLCTNKYLQRAFFLKHGIKSPSFRLIKNKDELVQIKKFPCIIKPVDSSASRGVKKVNNTQELEQQFQTAISHSKQGEVIVEDFIEGLEFSVESFTQNGVTFIVAITEKITIGEETGFFVENTHIIPARINTEQIELISKEVTNAIQLMGMNNCPSHTEIKLNESGAHIIEIACRLGGDYITSDLVPLSTGVDMLENLIKVSLGLKIDTLQKFNRFSAIQFLNTTNYKKCQNLIDSNDSHIVRYAIKPFHNHPVSNSGDRMGYVILQSESQHILENLLESVQ